MLVSIITVCFNNLEGLEATVVSVQNQTYSQIEHIIIDGKSTDGTFKYLQENNSKFSFWSSEPDSGIYNAMNKGLVIAKGDYILFLNSGDKLYNNKSISNFGPYFKTIKTDFLYGNIEVISLTKSWIKTYPSKLNLDYFIKDTLPHPATLINSACFKNSNYDENFNIVSDWKFFMLGVCKNKFTYQYIDAIISSFNTDGISSTNLDVVNAERQQVLKQEYAARLFLKKVCHKLKRITKK